ncbi:DMT family transporter [Novosphingobium sp. JCM 18896]|uniref:DMT family transporter n=1 Tax=Novosphingobium sp. JCM 18896 TaxID=2989731 RepID=UPI002222FA57|nr:DMT family transporter [Novosphingobium sp. JCM 18896]MCW1430503.1 DMT family transporter [Novosphingobium sp. JCM 18896]
MTSPTMPRSRVYAMLLIVLLLWAGNSIVGRAIREDIPPLTLALFRWSGGVLLLLPFAWHHIRAERAVIKANWPMILLLGAAGIGAFNGLLYSGLRETTASNALLIQAAIPALVFLFDFLLFRSIPRPAQLVGVALAAVGVATIIFEADPALLLALQFGRGDLLVLIAVTAWGFYTSMLRRRPPIHPLAFLALTFMIGVAAMLPGALLEWQHETIKWSPAVIGAIVYVAAFPSLIGYQMFNRAVAEIGAADTGQVISLQPLIGAALAALLLGEALHAYHLAGMVLILLGIAIPMLRRNN